MLIHNIILILLNIFEAKHDLYVIKGADLNNVIDNRKWHKWSGMFALGLAIYLSVYINIILGPLYLCYRATMFPMALNLFREKPLFYLSNAGFEGWFVKKHIQLLYFLGGLISIIILNLI